MLSILSPMLLTPVEMAEADRLAAQSGIFSFDLMIRAGHAVAAAALAHFPDALRFVVLCGPGNNGGDGYVAARALAGSGATLDVFALGETSALTGDAKAAFDLWGRGATPLDAYDPRPGDVVIDALFGAGLSRPVSDAVRRVIADVARAGLPVLAVDLPSGLCGLSGRPLGAAFNARRTVTFMARKPGHLLLPGRSLCGDIEIVDIGIPQRIMQSAAGKVFENRPELWRKELPVAGPQTHKYRRGHLVCFSGEASKTGAARLSAQAALKCGAGLVTLASPADALEINAAHLTAVMLREIDTKADLEEWLADGRLSTFVLGPGFGAGGKARGFSLSLSDRMLVLDADGITSFKDDRDALFAAFAGGEPHLVLTPHEGEFSRLFPDLAADDGLGKVEKALEAARRANAAVVYKGADTVIAAPDGRAAINTNGPPWLATAGSGDVLAGIIGALWAQGMPVFEAAAAGVYMHAEAANMAGPGMTAEDLADHVGKAMAGLATGR